MLRLRSWASSMMSVSYLRRSRSRCSSASRMPSVISLTRLAFDGAVGEADLVADDVAELGAELLGDPLGHRAGGDPARLGVADQLAAVGRARPAAELEADLRQLGGLARAGLAGDDHDLVVADRRGDVVAARGDRELGRVGDLHNGRHSRPPRQPDFARPRSPVSRGSLNMSGRARADKFSEPLTSALRSWNRPRRPRAGWWAGAGRVRRGGRRTSRPSSSPSKPSRPIGPCRSTQPPRSWSSVAAWKTAVPTPPTMMPASAEAISAPRPNVRSPGCWLRHLRTRPQPGPGAAAGAAAATGAPGCRAASGAGGGLGRSGVGGGLRCRRSSCGRTGWVSSPGLSFSLMATSVRPRPVRDL